MNFYAVKSDPLFYVNSDGNRLYQQEQKEAELPIVVTNALTVAWIKKITKAVSTPKFTEESKFTCQQIQERECFSTTVVTDNWNYFLRVLTLREPTIRFSSFPSDIFTQPGTDSKIQEAKKLVHTVHNFVGEARKNFLL